MTKRVIVVDTADTHFRAINELRDVEAFAFSSPALAIEAGRVLRPDLFIVGDTDDASDAARFATQVGEQSDLSGIPILVAPVTDPSELRARLRDVLGEGTAEPAHPRGPELRRADRHARHCDSLSRLALMENVDDEGYITAILREGCQSLRDEVSFASTLLLRDESAWRVESSFAPSGAPLTLPARGESMPLPAETAQDLLRRGTIFGVSGNHAVAAARISCGASLYVLFFAAPSAPLDAFDAQDRAYVETLASLCGARLRQRRQLKALRFHAEHDALTGILNRAAFRARGAAALRADAGRSGRVALAVLDIVRFHEVNATLGHQKGDALLVEVAAGLTEAAGDDIVGRLGGDAFGILMRDVGDDADIEERVARYTQRFAQPFSTGDREGVDRIALDARVGIACAPGDADTFEALLAHADAAMCENKRSAPGRTAFFVPALEKSLAFAHTLRAELSSALLDEDFVLHFQPIVDLATSDVVGAEALIRWNHPTRGLLLPDEFLPFAEENGLLRSIGSWVIGGVADAAVTLAAIDPSFRTWLNLSGSELSNPRLADRFAQCGAVQRSLGIEVRQGAALRDIEATLTTVAALKRNGLAVALDDFGTGNWPLTELKRLPLDVVKLDRSFTAGVPAERRDREIIEAVLHLGDRFGFATLAKGIETIEQARCLRAMGCDYGQGYLLGHPMPLGELAALLRARNAVAENVYTVPRHSLTERFARPAAVAS